MISYKLLIKFPTRGRVKKFFEVLDLYYKYSTDLKNTKFVISCDEDDLTMNNDYVKNKFYHYKNLNYYYGNNKSKIEAINADMEHDTDWDICLLASDDMIPQIEGYDDIIRNKMFENFKNTDGVLWFYDGIQERLNTLSIFGKKYYDRFGYIYNPSYYSLWCDNEFHQVADILNKQVYIKNCIIKHEHPAWGYGVADELMKRNDTYYKDEFIFNRRKDIYFNIDFDVILKYENRLKKGNSNVNEKNIVPEKIELKQNIEKPIEEVQNSINSVKLTLGSSHSILNDFVDKVYVINLKRRKDRLDHITEELQRFNISFERFNAIDGQKLNISEDEVRNAQIGCLRSHVGILKKALKSGHNKIAIFEDDIVMCDDFEDRFQYYSEKIPDNWDIMYLGCNLNQCKFPIQIKPYIHKVLKSYGCFAMILNNSNNLFQKIIEITEKEEKPIDNYYHDDILRISNAYLFYPFFVKTILTESDISQNKEKIIYDVVNRHFKNVVKLPVVKTFAEIQKNENFKSVKEICEDYLRAIYPFQIYYDNKLIFDSSSSDKINVNFFDDHFTLYGRIFSYRGMKIKNK